VAELIPLRRAVSKINGAGHPVEGRPRPSSNGRTRMFSKYPSRAQKVEGKKNKNPFIFSHGVFVRFSTRGVQKHYKKLFGESPCQKLLAEKVEEKKSFSCRLFPSIFFIAFLAVSLHEEPKNTIKIFSKIKPENRKKSQKKVPWHLRRFFFFFFFGAP
jgi:hypothetical protein